MSDQKQTIGETKNVYLLIVAGGQGTRLFPISHEACPKQFCKLDDQNTFIQATAKRFVGLGIKLANIVVIVTNGNQRLLAEEQLVPMGVLSQNILRIKPTYDYAGAMVKGAEYIAELDANAIIVNTPSDQHIRVDDNFAETIASAIRSAKANHPTIIGVKTTDLNTVRGCGHAMFDVAEKARCRKVLGFIEKPNEVEADRIMRAGNTACNTGVNVWGAQTILEAAKGVDLRGGLKIDKLMAAFGDSLRVAVGEFGWFDCGTLKALYQISEKTAHHRNASLGEGAISRHECRRSIFWAPEGYEIHATNIRDSAVIVNVIDGKIVTAVVKLDASQQVKELAEDFLGRKILTNSFAIDANNNIVARTAVSDLRAAFLGVDHHFVAAAKVSDKKIVVIVSNMAPKE